MTASANPGAQIGIHFMAMEYLLQGTQRTAVDLGQQMHLGHNQPTIWMNQAVYLGLMTKLPKNMNRDGRLAPLYSPTKVIVDKTEYNALRAQCGLSQV